MKKLLILSLITISFAANAQKVESIYFNLYTDSLKIGVHNYINVDGKMTNGAFYPLMSDELFFSSSAGTWKGNSLILDSAFNGDSVVIIVKLKNNAAVTKTVTIYKKRLLVDPPLKTEKELMEDWKRKGKGKP